MQDTCIHLLRSLESEQKSRMVINLTVHLKPAEFATLDEGDNP